ncbi:hypothetical protein KKE25_00500, partial [Patescibacteria group bacterium]|nr:hypothetical protein [Patescibacteria group bacterium]
VNLVFAKPVFSYTKFWQMIGRGTRVLDPDDIKFWCPKKDKFLIHLLLGFSLLINLFLIAGTVVIYLVNFR